MHDEFFQAAEAYAKKARRIAVGGVIEMGSSYDGRRRALGWIGAQRPFLPRWFLIEPVKGLQVEDVRFGAQSQFSSGPVPAELYSMDEALSLFEAPDSPAWDRFKLEPADGLPLGVGVNIGVELAETEVSEEAMTKSRTVRCVFIGDEPHFRPWEGRIQGRLVGITLAEGGPVAEISFRTGEVKVPIKPSDIPALTAKLGRPVKLTFSTEE